jgi:hypothetical protein
MDERDSKAMRQAGHFHHDPDRYFPNRMRQSWNPILHLED